MTEFDAKRYWIDRHKEKSMGLGVVGHRSMSDQANREVYMLKKERLSELLDAIEGISGFDVLDAGSGVGEFIDPFVSRGVDVTAVDISDEALQVVKEKFPGVNTFTADLASFDLGKRFNLVYSFDVLLHVVDDKEWYKCIESIANHSKDYLVFHGAYSFFRPFFTKKHLKLRNYKLLKKKLEDLGFKEVRSFPSMIFSVRSVAFPFRKLGTKHVCNLDRFLFNHFFKGDSAFFASHYFKVFRRV